MLLLLRGRRCSGAHAAIPSFPVCRFCAMEWLFLLVRVEREAHWQLHALPTLLRRVLMLCDPQREFSSSGRRSSTSQQGVSQETCWKLQSLDELLLGNLLSVFLPLTPCLKYSSLLQLHGLGGLRWISLSNLTDGAKRAPTSWSEGGRQGRELGGTRGASPFVYSSL